MKTTAQAIADGFEYDQLGYYRFVFDNYELTFEPLSYGNMYIAIYKDGELLTEKVPVRPIAKVVS